MRQLMISLDKKILDKNSAVARRMIEYGEKDELFIIIPNVEKIEFDLSPTVHVFTSWGKNKLRQFSVLYGVGERLLKKEKIDLISAQDPFFMGLVGVCFKKQFKLPIEIQVHGDFFGNNYYRFKSGIMNHLRWHIGKFVVRRADRVRVVGERIKQSLVKFGIRPEKIITRPIRINTENLNQTTLNLKEKYPGYEKIFLILARLEPVKNITWLTAVFKEVLKQKNYLLLIVGRGSEEISIRRQIINNDLDSNIKLQNWTEDPYGYLKTVDCVLFPSLSEGYGLVAMEANAIGTPIIMNDVGVANYELKPSDKVTILPINDQEKWIEAILKV